MMGTESEVAVDGRREVRPADVAEMIMHSVRAYPATPIVYADARGERVATYLDTYEESRRLLANLRENGVAAGDIVVLALEEPQDFIPSLWACVLGGVVPCPIIPRVADMDLWDGNLQHLSKLFDEPTFIASARNRKLFGNHRLITLEDLRSPVPEAAEVDERAIPDTAFLMLSSGSTGAPKAIVLTHENIIASMEGKRLATGMDDSDVTMNWIAFDHVAALTECHLMPLYTGSAQVQIAPVEVASNPLFFLQAISKYRVSHTFTPNFLLGQITSQAESSSRIQDQVRDLDLSLLKRIISGGEANVCATGERFLDAFAKQGMRRSVLWPAFGMTETCAGSIYSTSFESEIGKYAFASVGRPVPGLDLRIQSESGRKADVGEEGELQLRGDMVFNEYYSNENATAQAFTEDDWFRTGDLGLLDPDTGSLRLTGRSKDSIIVNGINYYLHELETAISGLEGTSPSFVASFPTRPAGSDTESLVVLYTPLEGFATPQQLRNINIAIRNVTILHWGFRPRLILPVSDEILTKTSLGKIQRSKLRKQYEAGEFDGLIAEFEASQAELVPPFVRPGNESEKKMVQSFARITGIPEESIGATSNLFSLGGTSLETLRLLAYVNDLAHAERKIALVDLIRDPTPRGIAALMESTASRAKEYDPIVPLQERGHKTPAFLIHPGVGEVLVFVNLANFFTDERPVYALRARGFTPGESFFGSFEELVSTYVEAIRRQQPHGPYLIAGYSYGGPVALPVAQKLEAMGETVHILVIDAPPVIEHPRGTVDRIESALMLSFFLDFIDREQLDSLTTTLRESQELDPAEYLFSLAPTSRIRELGQDLSTFKHWSELAFGLSQIGTAYQPRGTINDITVLYAQPIWGDKSEYLETTLRKWDRHSSHPVRYLEVPGEHHTILSPEFVDKFQDVFRSELARLID